jgi:hypothetical protein
MAQETVSTTVGAVVARLFNRALGQIVTWILPAFASLLIILLAAKLTNFYYTHAWASAHFATIARFFATHGIIGTHGIPIENNDPLTSEPDRYLHWPPFFFYVLSLVLRVFPDSIRAMHLFMATVAIANAVVMWRVTSVFFKPRAAIVCGSAFLLMPATLRYGLALLPVNLAVLEVSVAVLFMLRYLQGADTGRETSRDLGLSTLAFFLACITSWEPFLALPGLFLAYWFDRRSVVLKMCFSWAFAAMAAGGSILAIYSLSDPTFFRDLWSIFTFRVGLTQYLPLPTRVHPVEGQLAIDGGGAFSSIGAFVLIYVVRTQEFCGSLGIMGFFALLLTAFRRHLGIPNKLLAALLLPFCTFWLGWAVVMQNHYLVHQYQLVLATPVLAIAIASLDSLLEESRLIAQDDWLRESLAVLTKIALPCALVFLAISAAWVTNAGEDEPKLLASFGRLIKTEVPAGAIVLTNESSMVPVYYSERHVVRGIPDGAYVDSHLMMIKDLCRTCSIYLALTRQNEEKFREQLARMQPVFDDDNFIVKKLN